MACQQVVEVEATNKTDRGEEAAGRLGGSQSRVEGEEEGKGKKRTRAEGEGN